MMDLELRFGGRHGMHEMIRRLTAIVCSVWLMDGIGKRQALYGHWLAQR